MTMLTWKEGIEIKRRVKERKERTPVILKDFYSLEVLVEGYTESITLNKNWNDRTPAFYEYTTQQPWEGGKSREDFCRTMNITYECETGILTYYIAQCGTKKRSVLLTPITLIKPFCEVLL